MQYITENAFVCVCLSDKVLLIISKFISLEGEINNPSAFFSDSTESDNPILKKYNIHSE
jgi:hypothetical protein